MFYQKIAQHTGYLLVYKFPAVIRMKWVWLLFGDIKSVAFFHNRGMRYLFLGIIIRIRRAVVGQIHAPAFQQDVAIF